MGHPASTGQEGNWNGTMGHPASTGHEGNSTGRKLEWELEWDTQRQ